MIGGYFPNGITLPESTRPDFDQYGITNPDGTLKGGFKLNSAGYAKGISDVNLDNTGYDAYKKQATWDTETQGDSPWMKLMKAQMGIQQAQRADDLATSQSGAQAQARAALAMRGGLSGGAQQRLALQGQKNLLAGQQGLARQAMSDLAGMSVQDQKNRMDMLGNLSSLDVNRFQANLGKQKDLAELGLKTDQWNMQNAINDMKQRGQWDLDAWKKEMENKAAERNAQATENAGK